MKKDILMKVRNFRLKASRALLALGLLLVAVTLLLGLPPAEAAGTAADAKAKTANAASGLAEGVVARVNDSLIKREELEWATNAWLRNQGMDLGGMRSPGSYKSLERRVLERLIQEELILQAADRQGMTIDEEQVDARIGEEQARHASAEEFAARLEAFNMTMEEHRERTHRQLLLEEYVRVNIQPRVEIDEASVDAVYADYLAEQERKEQNVEARPEEEVRMLIRNQLAQQQLTELIGEHLQTLIENSEVQVGLS